MGPSRLGRAAALIAGITASLSLARVASFSLPEDFSSRQQRVLALPVTGQEAGGDGHPGGLARRGGVFDTFLYSQYSWYTTEVHIGSPRPQIVRAMIDTGAPDFWVNPDCRSAFSEANCVRNGFYDPADSRTAEIMNRTEQLNYVGGVAYISWWRDTLSLAGVRVPSAYIGVAHASAAPSWAILGLSYTGRKLNHSSIYERDDNVTDHPGVLDLLARTGVISSRLFSLYLGESPVRDGSQVGGLIFGGVDTTKYSGTLGKVPLALPNPLHYSIHLDEVIIRGPNATTQSLEFNTSTPFVLDSGSPVILLPGEMFDSASRAITQDIPGSAEITTLRGGKQHKYIQVPCNGTIPGILPGRSIDFRLGGGGGVLIQVPLANLTQHPLFPLETECSLPIYKAEARGAVFLGTPFLRHAFVVHDQENAALYMAQRRDCGGPGGGVLVEVPAGKDAAMAIEGSC